MEMNFEDLLKLLTKTAQEKTKASELIATCNNAGLNEIEYFNTYDDPMFNQGRNFLFTTQDGETGRLEIIRFDDELLQAGFQIIYKPNVFFKQVKTDFPLIVNFLKDYSKEEAEDYQGFETYSFSNDANRCTLSRSKVNGRHVLDFKISNSEIWEKHHQHALA